MRVFFDTMVFIYNTQSSSPFYKPASELIAQATLPEHRVISSLVVLGELLVLPRRLMDEFSEARFKRLFRSNSLELRSFSEEALEVYVELRAHDGVKPMDAFHLAVAAGASVDLFVTNDHKLIGLPIAGIGRVCGMSDALVRLNAG